MAERRIGIIMNGVTGRMGTNQHLVRSIAAIRADGGVPLANGFHGVIAGCHEVLRRQGLLEGTWCLDPREGLSPGQAALITDVAQRYPHLTDDAFARDNLHRWFSSRPMARAPQGAKA